MPYLNEIPPEWPQVLPVIENLARLPGISLHRCAEILQCELKLIVSNRFESRAVIAPFESVDIRKRSGKTGIIVLDVQPGPQQEFYAQAVKAMGQPVDIDIVSPPIANPQQPVSLPWDAKYSWCFELAGRPVWFEFEELRRAEKLVSVSIHFEAEPPVNSPRYQGEK